MNIGGLADIIRSIKTPIEIRSIWGKNDLPLEDGERESWLGEWNCRWTYETKNNKLKPYVDDIIEIKEVDSDTGELSGIGFSSYAEGGTYNLRGRVSNNSAAYIFYTSSGEKAGLSGMVILKRSQPGEIKGWWIDAGRESGDIGGGLTMEKRKNNTNFEIKYYKIMNK